MTDKKKKKLEEMKLNSLVHKMNLSRLVRYDVLDGKECLVIPTVLMVEGVHNGILYPSLELSKFPESWNGKPVTVNHPMDNGKPITANSPEIVKKQTVGKLFNVRWDNERLKGDVWIDLEKCNEVAEGKDVVQKLLAEENVEVSTGLFVDEDGKQGTWNDEDYEATASDYRPDHLALLPNSLGACSWEDGAGMPRINKKRCKGCGSGWKDGKVEGIETLAEMLSALELSHESIRDNLIGMVRGQFNLADDEFVFLKSVFNDTFIYVRENQDGVKLFQQDYRVKDNKVILEDSADEVQEQVSFVPVTNEDEDKQGGKKPAANKGGSPDMKREEKVKALIENESSQWGESDKDFLIGLEDEQFDKIEASVVVDNDEGADSDADKEAEAKAKALKDAEEVTDEDKGKDLAENKEKDKPVTLESYMADAPAEMRSAVNRAVERDAAIKAELVKALMENSRNKFSKEQLEAKEISELEQMADLADIPKDFSRPIPKDNSSDEDEQPPEPPVLFGNEIEANKKKREGK